MVLLVSCEGLLEIDMLLVPMLKERSVVVELLHVVEELFVVERTPGVLTAVQDILVVFLEFQVLSMSLMMVIAISRRA